MTDTINPEELTIPDGDILDELDDGLTTEDLQQLVALQAEGEEDLKPDSDIFEDGQGDGEDGESTGAKIQGFLAQPTALISVPKPSGTVRQMASRAMSWAASKNGVKETPPYSNIIFAWADVKPSWQGQPWCAAFVTDAWARQGVDLRKVISNPYYTPYLEAMGKKYGAWKNYGHYSPKPGDISLMGRNGHATHTGLSYPGPGNYSGYRQIEGNTASGNSGSQTNGDGCYIRTRGNFIRGWISMDILVPKLISAGLVGKPSSSPSPVKRPFSFASMMKAVPSTPSSKYPGKFNGNVRIVQNLMKGQSEMKGVNNDGIWTSKTTRFYAIWQQALGYKGKDADGIPGLSTLSKLVARGNYYLVP